MRVRLNSLQLRGTDRSVAFEPGLNIITGPIASGKTTLMRLCRSLLGGSFEDMPREARDAVDTVVGELMLGDSAFTVARPAVTTINAPVEVAGESGTYRLPAYRADARSTSYVHWLLVSCFGKKYAK